MTHLLNILFAAAAATLYCVVASLVYPVSPLVAIVAGVGMLLVVVTLVAQSYL